MKKRVLINVVILVIMVISLGIFLKLIIFDKESQLLRQVKNQNLGNLCYSEEECKAFCLNNRGRCESYCKGREDKLCQIIFAPVPETESVSNNVKVSNCVSNSKPIFTAAFIDFKKINSITQIGNNALYNPGSQARSYINMKHEPPYMVPIYAPIDSTLTGIVYAMRNLNPLNVGFKGEYRLDFQVSCEVRYAFDHLAYITDKIKEFAPKVPANNTQSNTFVSIPIHAGELIGYTDRNIIGGNWDFVFTNTAHEAPHINPARWTSDNSNHADCPYDYFIPELKDKYYALLEKSDNEITCGPLVRDIPGTIAGYWFKEDANEEHGKRFGIYGGFHFVEFILANEKDFLFMRDSGSSRISPSQVTIGKNACYFDNEKNKFAYLKLISETELGLVIGDGNCPSSFPEDYEIYER